LNKGLLSKQDFNLLELGNSLATCETGGSTQSCIFAGWSIAMVEIFKYLCLKFKESGLYPWFQ
jgi:hypothetical protein